MLPPFRIAILDDHHLIRHGIREVLQASPNYVFAGEADSFEALQDLLRIQVPDLLLLDIALPRTNGITIAEWLKEHHPDLKILVLSMYAEEEYVVKMVRLGARGYVLKNSNSTELLRAIERIREGYSYYSQEISEMMLRQYALSSESVAQVGPQLTDREREIIRMVAKDSTNVEMANALGLSVKTVESAKRELFRKLGVKNSMGLLRYAYDNGMLQDS
jgi:DNA-binding NarL/FixJ family response regulator